MIQRYHLGDHGDVLPRIERNRDEWNRDSENVGRLGVESRSVDERVLVPFLEAHYHFDPFLLADCANAEDRWDIDQTDPAYLHVMPLKLVAPADENVVASPRRDDEVIGDEPMTPLDQVEHTLGLSDPALSSEEKPNSKYVCEAAVQSCGLRELGFEGWLATAVELRSLEPCLKQRYPGCKRSTAQLFRRFLAFGHDDGRHVEAEERGKDALPLLFPERVEIRDLGLPQDLQALGNESLDIASQGEPGTRDVRVGNDFIEAYAIAGVAQAERLAGTFEKLSNRERSAQATFPTTRARSARLRSLRSVRIWFVSRSTAVASAVP